MKQWVSYPRSRRALVAGAAVATLAACASLAISTSARATLAPGTPLKTLAANDGGRYFGSDMTGDLLSKSTVTQLQAQQFSMLTPGNEMKWDSKPMPLSGAPCARSDCARLNIALLLAFMPSML